MCRRISITMAFLTVLNCIQASYAQRQNLDSVLRLIQEGKRDTLYVQRLNVASKLYLDLSNYDSSALMANEALRLIGQLSGQVIAKKHTRTFLTLKEETASAYNNLAIGHDDQGRLNQALKTYKRALVIDREINDKAGEQIRLGNIGILFAKNAVYDTALMYYNAALKICIARKDSFRLNTILGNMGNAYQGTSDYPKAIKYYEQAIDLAIRVGDRKMTAIWYANLAAVLWLQSNIQAALQSYFKALKITEEIGNKHISASILGALGTLYSEQGDTTQAIKYLTKAKDVAKEIEDPEGEAYWLNAIGDLYKHRNQFDEAMEYFQASLKIAKAVGSTNLISFSLGDIGDVFQGRKQYQIALKYQQQALEIVERAGDLYWQAFRYQRIGSILFAERKFTEAARMLGKALAMAKDIGATDILMQVNEDLSDLYTFTGDYQKALEHYKEYTARKDSIFSQENKKQLVKSQMNYEFEKKETAIKNAHATEIALKSAENRRQRAVAITIGIAILLITPFGFYIYKKRRDLAFQKQTWERDYQFKRALIEVQREALNAQLDTHFIGDTMDSINRFIKLNDAEAASSYLLKFNRLIRKVLENSEKREVTLKEELEVLDNYIQLALLRFPEKSVTHKVIVDESIDAFETLVPPMVLQIIVENAIKHGLDRRQGGRLLIEVRKQGEGIEYVVTDDGIGRTAAELLKDDRRRSYGTSIARRLIGIWNDSEEETSFRIVDLVDGTGNPRGTEVHISLTSAKDVA